MDETLFTEQHAAPASLRKTLPAHPMGSRRPIIPNEEFPHHLDLLDTSRDSKPDLVGKESGHIFVSGPRKQNEMDYSKYKGRGRYGKTVQK